MNIFKRLFGKKNEKIIISILDLATKQADGTESSIAKYIPMEISEILNLSDKIACNYYHLQIPGDTKEIISDSIYPEKVIDDLMYSTKSNYVVYGYIDINDLKNIEFKIFLYSNKYKKDILNKNIKVSSDNFLIQLHKIIQEISEIVINNNIQIPDNLLTEKFEAFRLVSIVMNTEISNNEKIQLLENSIRVDDSYGKAVILLAKIYEVENKIEESINTIESFFKKYNCYLVKLEYAGILFYLKKYDIAEKICLEVLNNKNGILQSKYLLANIKKSQKDLLSSEKYFLECIEEKPEYYNACLDLSSIYLIDKKYDKCIQLYNRIGKLHKNKIQFISNIATSYFYLEEYKKALKLYKNCYKIEKNASLSYNIYQTLKKLGKKKEAHKYFKEWENLNS